MRERGVKRERGVEREKAREGTSTYKHRANEEGRLVWKGYNEK